MIIKHSLWYFAHTMTVKCRIFLCGSYKNTLEESWEVNHERRQEQKTSKEDVNKRLDDRSGNPRFVMQSAMWRANLVLSYWAPGGITDRQVSSWQQRCHWSRNWNCFFLEESKTEERDVIQEKSQPLPDQRLLLK